MKKYDEIIKKEVFVCNCCGELIAAVDESDRAAFLDVRKAWGYFSKWDGCIHHFHICEKCYEKNDTVMALSAGCGRTDGIDVKIDIVPEPLAEGDR